LFTELVTSHNAYQYTIKIYHNSESTTFTTTAGLTHATNSDEQTLVDYNNIRYKY